MRIGTATMVMVTALVFVCYPALEAPGAACTVRAPAPAESFARVTARAESAIEKGVPHVVARDRSRTISEVRYSLGFSIEQGREIRGRAELRFELDYVGGPLVIDFAGREVESVRTRGGEVPFLFENEHILIEPGNLKLGRNTFEILFIPDEGPLHREENYLYTLFVPDRARFAFPCFDQPDIKARYALALDIPHDWRAVSNADILESRVHEKGTRKNVLFETTEPLSTYFFSFAAGKFLVEEGAIGERNMRMFHLEPDSAKVTRNAGAIFDLHAEALRWMEEYTGIDYPFGKFDIVVIPAFTYSGMEHPGAILYRAERLLLDESATEHDRLRRASVISHETAHMWFGDLVTMTWFDDVWLKEAFAQFMADRIIRSAFPGVSHELLFVASHYDPLNDVERTRGTHPIRQELANLNEAGSLYGNIIYHKPPVMLNQLEALMGEDRLREGLSTYLESYRYGNARWEDLIGILDSLTGVDLVEWSTAWVMERARPAISIRRIYDKNGNPSGLEISQSDPLGRGLVWPQAFDIVVNHMGKKQTVIPVDLVGPSVVIDHAARGKVFLLPDGTGRGFGYFELDKESVRLLGTENLVFKSSAQRARFVQILRDNLLEEHFGDPLRYLQLLLAEIERETVELNLQILLGYLAEAFWKFIADEEREALAAGVEELLIEKMQNSPCASTKAACFEAFESIVSTEEGVRLVKEIWSGEREIEGLTLSERDYCTAALELAARETGGWNEILDNQYERIENEELKARFLFVRRAVSADKGKRDAFFGELSEVGNRRHEPWVLEALYYLHHPLRVEAAVDYIEPSLELLEEIRRTGNIFFPRDWIEATLRYHTSDEAVRTVEEFLSKDPDYPKRLRLLVLQAADPLFRSNFILEQGEGAKRRRP